MNSAAVRIVVAEVLGFIVLLPACILHAWTAPTYPSIKPLPGRATVDQWTWSWLNAWYSNVEDGVSAQQALLYLWVTDKYEYVPYASTYPSWVPKWVIAYAWSAWRNGANNIKRPLRTDNSASPAA